MIPTPVFVLFLSYNIWIGVGVGVGVGVDGNGNGDIQGNIDPTITQNSCWSTPAGLNSGPVGQPTVPCCCSVQPSVTEDTTFLRQVVTDVVLKVPEYTTSNPNLNTVSIDTKRIYFGGHSNGCMLDMAMAAQESDLVAAVCCHSGSVLTATTEDYIPTPVWRIHGNLDITVPYDGSFSESRNVQVFTGAIEGHDYWGERNGCTESTVEDFRRRLNTGTIRKYTNCTDGADVELVTITGAGHNPYLRRLDFPLQTTFDTTEWAWDFCSRHSLKEEPFLEGVTSSPTMIPVPTAAPTEASGGPPRFCFSGTNTVTVQDERQTIPIRDVRVGDRVLVGSDDTYETVYAFGHRHDDIRVEFLQIRLESSHKLELSRDHMVFSVPSTEATREKIQPRAVAAEQLQLGDMVALADGTLSRIVSVRVVRRKGIYAPFTPSGRIVVSGALASIYVDYHGLGHGLAHISQAPLRFLCRSHTSRWCHYATQRDETTGMLEWLQVQVGFAEWYLSQSVYLQWLILMSAGIGLTAGLALLFRTLWTKQTTTRFLKNKPLVP